MQRRKITSILAGAAIACIVAVGAAVPAQAASSSLYPVSSCSGGKTFKSASTTMGDTSHNHWTSINNNQGKWWPGSSVWTYREFKSTKTAVNSINFTYTSHQLSSVSCSA